MPLSITETVGAISAAALAIGLLGPRSRTYLRTAQVNRGQAGFRQSGQRRVIMSKVTGAQVAPGPAILAVAF